MACDDRHLDDDRHALRAAPGLLERGVERGSIPLVLVVRACPRVTDARRSTCTGPARAGHDDPRWRDRRRERVRATKRVVRTVEVGRAAREQQPQDRHGLLEVLDPLAQLRERDPVRLMLGRGTAGADAQVEPTA